MSVKPNIAKKATLPSFPSYTIIKEQVEKKKITVPEDAAADEIAEIFYRAFRKECDTEIAYFQRVVPENLLGSKTTDGCIYKTQRHITFVLLFQLIQHGYPIAVSNGASAHRITVPCEADAENVFKKAAFVFREDDTTEQRIATLMTFYRRVSF